jgi:hypothetical protein
MAALDVPIHALQAQTPRMQRNVSPNIALRPSLVFDAAICSDSLIM